MNAILIGRSWDSASMKVILTFCTLTNWESIYDQIRYYNVIESVVLNNVRLSTTTIAVAIAITLATTTNGDPTFQWLFHLDSSHYGFNPCPCHIQVTYIYSPPRYMTIIFKCLHSYINTYEPRSKYNVVEYIEWHWRGLIHSIIMLWSIDIYVHFHPYTAAEVYF